MSDGCVSIRGTVDCGNYHSVQYRLSGRRCGFAPSALKRYDSNTASPAIELFSSRWCECVYTRL
jgi:hypothetical protein